MEMGGNYFRAMLLNSLDSFEGMWKITVYHQTLFLIISQLTTFHSVLLKTRIWNHLTCKGICYALISSIDYCKVDPTFRIFFWQPASLTPPPLSSSPYSGWMKIVSFIDREKRVTLKGKAGTQKISPERLPWLKMHSQANCFRKESTWTWIYLVIDFFKNYSCPGPLKYH